MRIVKNLLASLVFFIAMAVVQSHAMDVVDSEESELLCRQAHQVACHLYCSPGEIQGASHCRSCQRSADLELQRCLGEGGKKKLRVSGSTDSRSGGAISNVCNAQVESIDSSTINENQGNLDALVEDIEDEYGRKCANAYRKKLNEVQRASVAATPSSTPTTAAKNPEQAAHKDYVTETEVIACNKAAEAAKDCCGAGNEIKTLACAIGVSEEAAQNYMLIFNQASQVATSAGYGSGKLKLACDTMKANLVQSTSINVMAIGKCESRRRSCQETCDPTGKESSGSKDLWAQLDRKKEQCDGYVTGSIGMGAQVMMNGINAKISQACSNAVGSDSINAGDGPLNCLSPVYANTAACAQCKDPVQAKTNPICYGGGADDNTPVAGVSPRTGANGGSELGLGDDDFPQETPFGDPALGGDSEGGDNGQGGGGGAGPTGGALAGGGDDGPGGGAQGKVHDTDVLRGERGGGGYSASVAGGGSGGFRGYGSNSKARKGSGGPKFDLRQFLPGGKKDPRKRLPSSLRAGKLGRDIGSPTENIFAKITTRVRILCGKNRLYCRKAK